MTRLICSLLILVLLLSLSTTWSQAQVARTSPRKTLLAVLSAAGCTNVIVANYIIDAVQFSIPSATVQARLRQIPNVLAVDISKVADPYMKALTTYLATKK